MITDLPSLESAVLAWAARTGETSLEENIGTMVSFAEAAIERELRLDSQLRSVTYTPATDPETGDTLGMDHVSLPDDFNAVAKLQRMDGASFTWRPHDELTRCGDYLEGDCSVLYSIMGCELAFVPPQTAPVTLRYYKKFPRLGTLAAGSQSHAQLVEMPDLYLYGTLNQLIVFDRAYEEAPIWASKYQEILGALKVQSVRARYPQDQPLQTSVGRRGRRRT